MDTNRRRLYWRICYGSAALLAVLAFSPLVTPSGVHTPTILGMPYTLWTGILITIGLVLLTYAATRVYPVRDPDTDHSLSSKPKNDT